MTLGLKNVASEQPRQAQGRIYETWRETAPGASAKMYLKADAGLVSD